MEVELLSPAESSSGGRADSAERLRLLPLTVEQQLGLIQIHQNQLHQPHQVRAQVMLDQGAVQDKTKHVHQLQHRTRSDWTELDQTGVVLYCGQRLPAVLWAVAKHRHQPPVQVRHLQLELIQVVLKALKGRSYSDAGRTSQAGPWGQRGCT